MKEVTIPLVGNPVGDQQFKNCLPIIDPNPVTGSSSLYLQKRFGTTTSSTTGGFTSTANFTSFFQASIYETASNRVYKDGALIGTVTTGYVIPFINSTMISGKEYVCFVAYSSDGTISEGYYHPSDATVASFTGDRTSGSPVINNIASTTGLYAGQLITATGFTSAARILSVDSATQVTINENASSGAPTSTVVFVEKLAKILDSDFPTNAQGGFAFIDGWAFIHTFTGRIYNSALNSVTSWSSSNYISSNISPDQGKGVYEFDGQIIAFGRKNITFYKNEGNPSGSPLSYTRQHLKIGLKDYIAASVVSTSNVKVTKSGLYFIGESESGTSVYELSTNGIVDISTPAVRNLLSGVAQSIVGEIYMKGQTGIVFAFTTNNDTVLATMSGAYVYWPVNKVWTVFTDPTDGGSDTGRWALATNTPTGETILCGTGKRFSYTQSGSYVDDSVAFSMIVTTNKTDFGTDDLKTVWEVALMGSDIQSSGTATLEYSDDDYTTWTTAGTFDMTKINPRISRVGAFRGGRAWRLTHSANTDFRAQALKFKYDVGVH